MYVYSSHTILILDYVEDVANTVRQMINMTKKTRKYPDAGPKNHQRLVALATKF
jgi:hypothetical protein